MKHFLILAICLSLMPAVQGQDLIVTKTKDSIQCKITKVKAEVIYFVFKNKDSYENTLIDRSQVQSFQRRFYANTSIPKDSLPGYQAYPRHLFALNSGFSYDPGQNDDGLFAGLDDYVRELRSGFHIEGHYAYYVNKNLGFGLSASYFRTNASQGNVPGTDGMGNNITADLSNNITSFYIGPLASYRFMSKNQKNAFIWNTSFGYISYEDTYRYVLETVTSGNGIGGSFSLEYTIGLDEHFSLGVQAGITSSLFRTIEIDDGVNTIEVELPRGNRLIGSARIDFSVGIRYQL